jgi:hypothetical protein
MISFTDKNLLPAGTIGLEPWFGGEGEIYYDNMAVCELSAPFVSLPIVAALKK